MWQLNAASVELICNYLVTVDVERGEGFESQHSNFEPQIFTNFLNITLDVYCSRPVAFRREFDDRVIGPKGKT